MLFKKVKDSSGMIMFINEINISGKDMINILGKPHITDLVNDLKPVHQSIWKYEILGEKFKIEYNSNDQAHKEFNELKKTNKDIRTTRIKLKPIEQITFGTITGDTHIVKNFIIPYLHILNKDEINSDKLHGMIKFIFEE